MRAARHGDSTAFAVLYGRYERRLLALGRRLLADRAAAEEVAQQAVVEALVGLPRLVVPEHFGPWLLAIAANLCRRRLRSPSQRLASLDALRARGAAPEPAAGEPEPPQVVETAEQAKALARALSQLPPGQRAALELFYLRDLTLAETAGVLGIRVGAVKARLHKGRLALRQALAGEGAGNDTL